MGDLSEMRGLISVICFIGCLVFFMAIIPPQLMVGAYEGRTVVPPDYFEAIDIQAFKEWDVVYLNDSDYEPFKYQVAKKDADMGGHDFDVMYNLPNSSKHEICFRHVWSEWIFLKYWADMHWTNREGRYRHIGDGGETWLDLGRVITSAIIEEDLEANVAKYTVSHPESVFVVVYFGFNDTIYESLEEAWDYNGLAMFVGINFDQTKTGYNAWDLIAMLLFFQLPDIHWIINALIALPLWACIAYLTYIFILRALGSIFGGGGA